MWPILFALFATAMENAAAQTYPSRPVRLLVPFAPGGGNDFLARVVGVRLSEALGQQFISDNRAGGGGILATDLAAKATPDGYTLLLGFVGPLAISPGLGKVPYDPLKDFTAISMLASSYHVLAVHPQVPARSVKELIALAKARPGQLNYASGGSGTPLHLVPELFKTVAGIDITHIPYKGSSPAAAAVIAGEAQLLFGNITSSLPQVRAGRLVALAVTSPGRSPLAPEVPTLTEAGLPGVDVASWYALIAPAATPRAAVNILNAAVVNLVASNDYREQLTQQAFEPMSSKPEQFPAFLREEISKWAGVIKSAGVNAD